MFANLLTSCTYCTCEEVCSPNVSKPNNGRLQIWYGTGANGKTTLLNETMKRVMDKGKTVKQLTPEMFGDSQYDLGMLEDNIGLFVIREPEDPDELDYIIRSFADHGNKWVRHIVCTNVNTSYTEDDPSYVQCYDLVEFTHTFNQ